MNWQEIRSHYPALDSVTYLNTAAGGAMCRRAAKEAKAYYDEMVTHGDGLWDEWLERTDETRQQVASYINAQPEEIAFLSNTSAGLNFAAELFNGTGGVLTMADDYPSVTLPWLHRNRPVRFLPSLPDGSIPLKTIAESISNNTDVVAVSHVQYRTGCRLDLTGLGKLCRSRGLVLVVDATQSVGALPVDVMECQVDVLIFSGYKWVTAGYGIAPMYVKREILQSRRLPSVGWRTSKNPYDLRNDLLDLTTEARGLELGHPPFPGIFSLRGALHLLEQIGSTAIEAKILELTDYLHSRMDAAGIPVLSPRDRVFRSGITMLAVQDPLDVVEQLKQRRIATSARGEAVRVALHFYNNEDDIDRFAREIRRLAGP